MQKRSFYEEARQSIKSNFFIYRNNYNLTIDEISLRLKVSREFVYRVVRELSVEIAQARGDVTLANVMYHSELLTYPELSHPGPRDQRYRSKQKNCDSSEETESESSGESIQDCHTVVNSASFENRESDLSHMLSDNIDDNFISSMLGKFESLNTELNEIKTIIKKGE